MTIIILEEDKMKITRRQLRKIIREVVEGEDINPYGTGNYSYHDEDETEEMIGHTWLTHGKIQDESLREALGIEGNPVGKIDHHDLEKNGRINYYNITINGQQYKNIPARMVEAAAKKVHEHEERDWWKPQKVNYEK